MSAPPPNYSSLDRYGNEAVTGQLHGRDSSADSTESVTLLLGDAVPDVEEGNEEEDEEDAGSRAATATAVENGTRRSR